MTSLLTPILDVRNLTLAFGKMPVVNDLSFTVNQGETLAIVGESGSGKSMTSLAIMGLLPHIGGRVDSGSIEFKDEGKIHELTSLSDDDFRRIRGNDIAMIFQEPMTSLNPVFSIGSQITEALELHRGLKGAEAENEAARLLDLVRLPNAKAQLKRYPHQLSGGMRQRVMIAMAASCNPKLLIADEPTTALDVTIQAQVLQIIRDMQSELNTAVIFISHDMGVVAEMADDIIVMKRGDMIESNSAQEIILRPGTDYTRQLMAAVPKIGAMTGKSAPEKFDLIGQSEQAGSSGKPETAQQAEPTSKPDNKPFDNDDSPLVSLKKVTTHYPIRSGFWGKVRHRVHAAESISFDIYAGETVALVGESGSGKSTVGKTLQQLVTPAGGEILFRGQEMLSAPPEVRDRFKREIQYVFQDPYGSLNPRKTIKASLLEPMYHHGLVSDPARQVAELLESVQLPAEFASRYPHEFSGGQRQRICIARALACKPQLIIADEAVSALDVSVQAQVVNLLMDLQKERGLSYLFISHDMAVVERISHRVAVMYLGQIVEMGTRQQIFENPQHPYTQRLLSAVPMMDPLRKPQRPILDVEIPSPIRAIENPPLIHTYREINIGHIVAENLVLF
ncbi:ABC transporter ATP-binding protein [Neptunomonas qingdaonensis]|uniref:Glutathione import ATP-binding protein GsiA n=1 Tax=Neptunomonas qingdaonensis TaxID=1045558 RepID=A0A1I2QR54_9GAMM|nr:ABC transporter ATP-binding protein [Neptunomonas qingdaonensis]SFG30490.1 glutathione transport system ATP-binding protein [Neptunomonas qingdaonensis]